MRVQLQLVGLDDFQVEMTKPVKKRFLKSLGEAKPVFELPLDHLLTSRPRASALAGDE
jgi:hypothetical protein